MEYADKKFDCVRCNETFVWSRGEQDYFAKHGLKTPRRCRRCREEVKQAFADSRAIPGERVAALVLCAECGNPTCVPFIPTDDRPVFCRTCFLRKKLGK